MTLLQTGDLHLGKTLHETSLIDDQRQMLESLRRELSSGGYDALVIAGDVYDRTIPPAEAVALFSDFLVSLRRDCPEADVLIIPGNHDSAQRLAFAGPLLESRGIYLVCDPADSFTPVIAGRGDRKAAFFLLPYLAPGSLESSGEGLSSSGGVSAVRGEQEFDFSAPPAEARILATQGDLAREAALRYRKALSKPEIRDLPKILVSHCFALGGVPSESERAFLGGAERVDPELFRGFDYVALGHLHKAQRVADRVRYAGAPLVYAFDEAGTDKSFLRVELTPSEGEWALSVESVPVVPKRKVSRLSGDFADFYGSGGWNEYKDHYLEITLQDKEIVVNPMNLLKSRFPWLLSVRQEALDTPQTPEGIEAASREERKDALDDFRSFQESLYGKGDPDKEGLFEELLREARREA